MRIQYFLKEIVRSSRKPNVALVKTLNPALRRLLLTAVILVLAAHTAQGQQWVQTTPLPDGYQEQGLVYSSGFLYQTGGSSRLNGDQDGTNVFYAPVYTNGIVGVWNTGTQLPEAVLNHAAVTLNGFVYVLGGYHYTPASNDFISKVVYYSKIHSDGSIGPRQVANPMPYSAFFESASIWNNRIYIIGGWTSAQALTSAIYSANIQPDGSLSAWVAQTSVPDAIYTQGEVSNGYLYVLGGVVNGGEELINIVYYTRINADGTLGGWNPTQSLPQVTANPGAVAASGYIFTMTGFNGSSLLNTFYMASVAGDGSVGSWSAGTPLPQALTYSAAAVSDSYIFVSGGAANTGISSAVYSLNLPPPPTTPALILPSSTTNGNFQLELTSSRNTGFGIQASTDLTTWIDIGWGFTDTNGDMLFQDTNAASFPNQFYRAYWPLP